VSICHVKRGISRPNSNGVREWGREWAAGDRGDPSAVLIWRASSMAATFGRGVSYCHCSEGWECSSTPGTKRCFHLFVRSSSMQCPTATAVQSCGAPSNSKLSPCEFLPKCQVFHSQCGNQMQMWPRLGSAQACRERFHPLVEHVEDSMVDLFSVFGEGSY